jgi:hypothetical protein
MVPLQPYAHTERWTYCGKANIYKNMAKLHDSMIIINSVNIIEAAV